MNTAVFFDYLLLLIFLSLILILYAYQRLLKASRRMEGIICL